MALGACRWASKVGGGLPGKSPHAFMCFQSYSCRPALKSTQTADSPQSAGLALGQCCHTGRQADSQRCICAAMPAVRHLLATSAAGAPCWTPQASTSARRHPSWDCLSGVCVPAPEIEEPWEESELPLHKLCKLSTHKLGPCPIPCSRCSPAQPCKPELRLRGSILLCTNFSVHWCCQIPPWSLESGSPCAPSVAILPLEQPAPTLGRTAWSPAELSITVCNNHDLTLTAPAESERTASSSSQSHSFAVSFLLSQGWTPAPIGVMQQVGT